MTASKFRSARVLSLAKTAYQRAGTSPDESEVCIALCAATLEGFMNELAFAVRTWTAPPDAVALAGLLDEAEEARASPVAKLRFAAYALSGDFPLKGEQQIQRVSALFRLRNSLMHLRPEPMFTTIDEHPYIEKNLKHSSEIALLISEGLVSLPTNYTGTWRDLVVQQQVARWAYNTTVQTMLWLQSKTQDPSLLSVLGLFTTGLTELNGSAA
jgi:hypothetical protein